MPVSSIENNASKNYELLKLFSAHNGHVGTWYNYHFFSKKGTEYVVYFFFLKKEKQRKPGLDPHGQKFQIALLPFLTKFYPDDNRKRIEDDFQISHIHITF